MILLLLVVRVRGFLFRLETLQCRNSIVVFFDCAAVAAARVLGLGGAVAAGLALATPLDAVRARLGPRTLPLRAAAASVRLIGRRRSVISRHFMTFVDAESPF